MHDIAADEAEDLHRILEPFGHEAPATLVGHPITQDAAELKPEQLQAALQWRCVAYRRLMVCVLWPVARTRSKPRQTKTQAIIKLLDVPLAEIGSLWAAGALQEDGLAGEEVQRLVQALFEASDARQRVLAMVESELH